MRRLTVSQPLRLGMREMSENNKLGGKIKNVIFDFGQVLVHFVPEYMVRQYVSCEEDVKLLSEVVFDRLYWDKLDAGTITDNEVVSACLERLPERLHSATEKIYYNWIYNIPEIEGMEDVVKKLKNNPEVRLFLLSNISNYFADHAKGISILSLFDKCFFSARLGMVKPHADIFDHLLRDRNIKAEETVFIDDSPKNINGAEAVGIEGYLFDGNVKKLKEYLKPLLR